MSLTSASLSSLSSSLPSRGSSDQFSTASTDSSPGSSSPSYSATPPSSTGSSPKQQGQPPVPVWRLVGEKSALRGYLTVLGVTPEASLNDIRLSYKKLALQWHPDRNDDPKARSKFQEISDAYMALCVEEGDSQEIDLALYGQAGQGEYVNHTGLAGVTAGLAGVFPSPVQNNNNSNNNGSNNNNGQHTHPSHSALATLNPYFNAGGHPHHPHIIGGGPPTSRQEETLLAAMFADYRSHPHAMRNITNKNGQPFSPSVFADMYQANGHKMTPTLAQQQQWLRAHQMGHDSSCTCAHHSQHAQMQNNNQNNNSPPKVSASTLPSKSPYPPAANAPISALVNNPTFISCDASIQVSWNQARHAELPLQYQVQMKIKKSYQLVYQGAATNYTVPSLLAGSKYTFRFRSVPLSIAASLDDDSADLDEIIVNDIDLPKDSSGIGQWSNPFSVQTSGTKDENDNTPHPPVLSNLQLAALKKDKKKDKKKNKNKENKETIEDITNSDLHLNVSHSNSSVSLASADSDDTSTKSPSNAKNINKNNSNVPSTQTSAKLAKKVAKEQKKALEEAQRKKTLEEAAAKKLADEIAYEQFILNSRKEIEGARMREEALALERFAQAKLEQDKKRAQQEAEKPKKDDHNGNGNTHNNTNGKKNKKNNQQIQAQQAQANNSANNTNIEPPILHIRMKPHSASSNLVAPVSASSSTHPSPSSSSNTIAGTSRSSSPFIPPPVDSAHSSPQQKVQAKPLTPAWNLPKPALPLPTTAAPSTSTPPSITFTPNRGLPPSGANAVSTNSTPPAASNIINNKSSGGKAWANPATQNLSTPAAALGQISSTSTTTTNPPVNNVPIIKKVPGQQKAWATPVAPVHSSPKLSSSAAPFIPQSQKQALRPSVAAPITSSLTPIEIKPALRSAPVSAWDTADDLGDIEKEIERERWQSHTNSLADSTNTADESSDPWINQQNSYSSPSPFTLAGLRLDQDSHDNNGIPSLSSAADPVYIPGELSSSSRATDNSSPGLPTLSTDAFEATLSHNAFSSYNPSDSSLLASYNSFPSFTSSFSPTWASHSSHDDHDDLAEDMRRLNASHDLADDDHGEDQHDLQHSHPHYNWNLPQEQEE